MLWTPAKVWHYLMRLEGQEQQQQDQEQDKEKVKGEGEDGRDDGAQR